MLKELDSKTALVTGGSRGLGRSMAIRLAAAGALVAINYAENSDAAKETVELIRREGGEAFAVQGKIGAPGEVEKLVSALNAELVKRTGTNGLDILVNNIGGGDYGPISEVSEERYDREMSNNVRGPFFLTKAVYHQLRDNGRVINISSTGARLTDPNIIVYTMAKSAVEAFTRVLAADLGPRGITVNSVGPGFTAGPTNEHVLNDPAMKQSIIDNTLLRRIGQPEEIADIVYLLASPQGRWITAQNIDASGGFKL